MFIGFIGLFILGLLLLGGLLVLSMLLYHRRTRVAGVVVLVGGTAAVVLRLLMFVSHGEAVHDDYRQVAREHEIGIGSLPPELDASGRKPVLTAGEKPKATAAIEPERPEERPGVVTAMGKSLAKGASETASDSSMGRASQKAPSALLSVLQALARAIKWEDKRPGSGSVADPLPPDWVEAEPAKVGGVYQATASVGPYTSREECDQAESTVLLEIAAEYAEKQLNLGPMRDVQLSEQCLKHLKKETWEEERITDFGPGVGKKPMIRRYLRLEFDDVVNRELEQQVREAKIRRRLRFSGWGLASLLGALGLTFGYLKINLATGGRYRGRLRATVLAVILGAVAANALILAG